MEHQPAYAVLTAVGPGCFGFRFEGPVALGERFGLTPGACEPAWSRRGRGKLGTFVGAGLLAPTTVVVEPIPVRSPAASEEMVGEDCRSKLADLYGKPSRR